MNSYIYNNSINEEFDYFIIEKRIALSCLDYIEEEEERYEEKDMFERKITRINSNCVLVSCESENESEYANMNDSTNDY